MKKSKWLALAGVALLSVGALAACSSKSSTSGTTYGYIYNSDPVFINAIYGEADNVNNFMGKLKKKSLTETNSGVNSSSTELVEEPSSKRKKK